MSAPIVPSRLEVTPHRPRRSTWKLLLLTLAAIAALISSWLVSIHIHYRRQMEAVAVVERLGGSVHYHYSAPEWLLRLQPGSRKDDDRLLGPDWLREWLPAEILLNYTLVIDGVSLGNGPGHRFFSNLSGERRDFEDRRDVDPTDDDLKFVARFTKLELLVLRDTRITDAGLKHLDSLCDIKTLCLGNSQISDEGLAIVAGFKNLKILQLEGTRITDAGLATLVNLKHLEELDVRATPVTEAGLKPFRGRTGLSVRQDDPNEPMPRFLITY